MTVKRYTPTQCCQHDGTYVSYTDYQELEKQLEAERQRADVAEARVAEFEQVWPTGTPLRLVLDENISLKAKLANPVVFPERKKASFYSDYQFSNKDLASVYNGAIREIKHKLHAAGFTVKE